MFGSVVLVASIYQGIAPFVFVGFECGLFGVLLCCVGLWEGLFMRGWCKWRVGVAYVNFVVWAKCALGVGIR